MADINSYFQQYLGRQATADEVSYLNKFIQEGYLQPGEIGQVIAGLPGAQGRALESDLPKFQQAMSAQDQGYLQSAADMAGAQAQSRFAGLGRPNSSAMAAQVFGQTGQAAQNLAMQRQSALAQFYGQGLQQNRALTQAYGQGALERGYGLRDEARQRQYQIEHRNYMKGLYDEYAAQQRKSNRLGAIGNIAGTALGMGAGAMLGGGLGADMGGRFGGAMMGGRAGGGLGQNFGGLFGGY